MKWPAGGFSNGRRVSCLIELIDLVPTFLDAAGLKIPSAVQGKTLLPLLQGAEDENSCRRQVYAEYYNAWTHKDAYGTMLRTKDWKIVVYHGTNQGELYDLANDQDEFFNLWDDPNFQVQKNELILRCFDASVLSMDPDPPRLGPF